MKRTLTIILAMAGLIVLPALLSAQTSLGTQFKTGFLQNYSVIKNGKQPGNGNYATNSTSTHLHGKSQYYYWDSSSNSWVWANEEISRYNSNGQIIFDAYILDTTTNDTVSKSITTYGANGSIYVKAYSLNGTKLYLSDLDSTIYDNNGSETRYVVWEYVSNAWVLNQGTAYKITYNTKGSEALSIETQYNATTQKWVNYEEDEGEFNNDGSGKADTVKKWNGTAWVNYQLLDSVTWIKWNGKEANSEFSSAYEQVWKGNAWVDTLHISESYGANGTMNETLQVWQANKWVNDLIYSKIYDSLGNNTGYKIQKWFISAWILGGEELINYTYDGNGNVTQAITQSYNPLTQKYLNIEKILYSDFSTLTGIKQEDPTIAQISIYPNPATETLHLQENINASENVNISICNMQGQILLSKQINSNDLSAGVNITVSNLANGIYVLHAVSASQESSQKFIKQ